MEENKNPTLVTNTIIDSNKPQELTLPAYPMTIRRYALLEKLDSPFVGGNGEFTVDAIVPAAYIISTPNEKLREYTSEDAKKIRSDAFDWAEQLSINDLPSLVQNLTKQLQDMNKAAPDPAPASNMTKKN